MKFKDFITEAKLDWDDDFSQDALYAAFSAFGFEEPEFSVDSKYPTEFGLYFANNKKPTKAIKGFKKIGAEVQELKKGEGTYMDYYEFKIKDMKKFKEALKKFYDEEYGEGSDFDTKEFKEWRIMKAPSGAKYLMWGTSDEDTYIIIYSEEENAEDFAVSYYAFGGPSGNDGTNMSDIKNIPKRYQGDFEDLTVPKVPAKKMKELTPIADSDVDDIPYED